MGSTTVIVSEFEETRIIVVDSPEVRIIVPVSEEDEGIFDFTFGPEFE